MSYSCCLACKRMVSAYEKYCPACVSNLKVQQDPWFWKDHSGDFYLEPLRSKEIKLDQARKQGP